MSGWGDISRNAQPKINQIFGGSIGGGGDSSGDSTVVFGLVSEVNYTPGTNQGKIQFSAGSGPGGSAYPLFPSIFTLPIIGEMVIIIDASDIRDGNLDNDGINYLRDTNAYFYISPINLWNTPGGNGVESPSPSFPINKIDALSKLQLFQGDVLFKGRYGNSIRLGSSNPAFANESYISDEAGEPIIIINNGNTSTVEDIQNDLSSIYLTSYQKIANFSLAKQTFSSYNRGHEPEIPKEFTSPQIILNSDRVTLNAKTDNVLISGYKSVFLSSNKSINTTSKEFYIDSIDIRLGSPNASEPVLLGNETVKELIKLTNQIKKLGKIAEKSQIYPGGVPAPNAGVNFIGTGIVRSCNNIINKLLDDQRGIKSNFVKTR